MFTGTYTAIVTPFKNGLVDETAFRKLVEFQIENGVDGVLMIGAAPYPDFDKKLKQFETK